MLMLHTVIRPAIPRARIAEPAYSSTCPVPPAVPMRAMSTRMRSLASQPGGRSPSARIRIVLGRRCASVWVASTCSTSLVPIPKASAPKAPCVEVWLSPQTIVVPGSVVPCSGPIPWTMPCRTSSAG